MEENLMQGQPEPAVDDKTDENTGSLTLKFNKEVRQVPYDEAVTLAQKGLKFDKISGELERLRFLATKKGKNIADFITELETLEAEKRRAELIDGCGGNEQLAEHILSLEGKKADENSFSALQKEFPEIKSMEELPDEVISALELTGGNALSAYLLYLHRQEKICQESRLKQEMSNAASVGSKQGAAPDKSGGIDEFIKGIWN